MFYLSVTSHIWGSGHVLGYENDWGNSSGLAQSWDAIYLILRTTGSPFLCISTVQFAPAVCATGERCMWMPWGSFFVHVFKWNLATAGVRLCCDAPAPKEPSFSALKVLMCGQMLGVYCVRTMPMRLAGGYSYGRGYVNAFLLATLQEIALTVVQRRTNFLCGTRLAKGSPALKNVHWKICDQSTEQHFNRCEARPMHGLGSWGDGLFLAGGELICRPLHCSKHCATRGPPICDIDDSNNSRCNLSLHTKHFIVFLVMMSLYQSATIPYDDIFKRMARAV